MYDIYDIQKLPNQQFHSMNAERFLNEKEALINQIDLLRQHIEQTTVEDAYQCCQKYLNEEDPMGVAIYELLYTQTIMQTQDKTI